MGFVVWVLLPWVVGDGAEGIVCPLSQLSSPSHYELFSFPARLQVCISAAWGRGRFLISEQGFFFFYSPWTILLFFKLSLWGMLFFYTYLQRVIYIYRKCEKIYISQTSIFSLKTTLLPRYFVSTSLWSLEGWGSKCCACAWKFSCQFNKSALMAIPKP